jgi:outer membrane protein assembly factor BamB
VSGASALLAKSARPRTDWWGSWIESTASVADGLAYIGASDYRRVTCFDPRDGRVAWRTDVFGWAWGRPLVAETSVYVALGGVEPYFIHHHASVTALDRASGTIKWRWPVPAPAGAFHWGFAAGIAGDKHTLVIGGLDGTLYAFPAE